MLSLRNKFLRVFLLLFLGFHFTAYAQREIDSEAKFTFKSRSYYGGSLGLQFGTVTLVDLSPLMGIMLNSRLSTGLGATYQYYEDNRFQGNAGSSFGGRAFVRYNLLPNIFAYSEGETINWNAYNYGQDNFQRTWTEAFFIGGGYFASFGPRGGANFTFLYNLRYSNREAYYIEPYLIRVGFVF
jgi:hypothetical protein